MRTALIQMSVTADREENIARACAFFAGGSRPGH